MESKWYHIGEWFNITLNLNFILQGGKCSICGEDYAKVKRFEKGGDMYRGYIVRSYSKNSIINVDVEVEKEFEKHLSFI